MENSEKKIEKVYSKQKDNKIRRYTICFPKFYIKKFQWDYFNA